MFCDNARCKRRIFTERQPGVAAPWARKTARLSERLTAVGLALGGSAGVRLGRKLGLGACRNTLLNVIRQALKLTRFDGAFHTFAGGMFHADHTSPVFAGV